jgi:CubicO group peptidase (beta-lactamase class C family)
MRASPQGSSHGGGWGIHGEPEGDQRSRGPGVGSVEHFRLLAQHGRDLIYRYRLRPVPEYDLVSPAVLDLTGYTPEEFYADPELGLKLVYLEDRPSPGAAAARGARRGGSASAPASEAQGWVGDLARAARHPGPR